MAKFPQNTSEAKIYMVGKLQLLQRRWEQFWQPTETYPLQENIRFGLRIGLLGLLYFYIDFAVEKTTMIPTEKYSQSIIGWEFLKTLFSNIKNIVWLPLILVLVFFWRRLNTPWQAFSHHKTLRILSVTSTALLAWVFSTYDFNLYYNQAHYFDRILLLIFIPLVWRRPIFILFFLLTLYPVLNQFKIFGLFCVTNFHLPIHTLMMILAYFLFYIITKSRHISDFIFLFGCMYFAHYWWSGWNKISEEWLFHDPISALTSVVYANGWLGFLTPQDIGSLIGTISTLDAPIRLFVLVIELGCLFFLFHKKLPRFFLISFIFFHIGVFLMYGICFWLWIILDLVFLILLWKDKGFSEHFRFNKFQNTVFRYSDILLLPLEYHLCAVVAHFVFGLYLPF